ncbi:MAG: glutamine-synthetase adenylyltransferase [Paracoccaceae bacterium]|nr:glutamine-synthetase adenylyltransferase [Paracoccaceae bacterium]
MEETALASRITRVPRAFDPGRGAEAVDAFGEAAPELRELIAGTAGSSPYLAGLLTQEADWSRAALAASPEAAFEGLLAEVADAEGADTGSCLRRVKRRAALLIALADLGGVWPLEATTAALTRLADAAVAASLRLALSAEIARGRLPGIGQGDLDTGAGLAVIAMGKMGAFELNYSSDIDLICLFDEARFDPGELAEARSGFVRATRKMCALLSETTQEGYVFRTDLRLRPDAAVTPVAMSMAAAERYYESAGRTWERAAYIKARVAAGDVGAGKRFLETLTPFVWRRHLDYWAIEDAHDMRLRIRAAKGLHGALSHLGHDLKLGAGGIREIEFFTQTRQLIAGGRDRNLRVRGTVDGLSRLAAAGWIGSDEADHLTQDYRAHRDLEHRVQMIADQQTHALPKTEEEFARVAALAGQDPGDLAAEVVARLRRVQEATEGFFAPPAPGAEATPPLSEASEAIVARWPDYPALRSARAAELFARVRPALLARLAKAADPQTALGHIDGFLAGLPAGVQVFSLFDANPQLLDLIVDIADTSPALAAYLARNAGVFDAVIGGAFFGPWPGHVALAGDLARTLGGERDYERKLDAARVWAREWHFRIGVHFLRGLISGEEAGWEYADLARAVLESVWPVVVENIAARHGPPPGRGAAIVGMGSLGAGTLAAASDLDLIVIFDPDGVEMSAGPRSIPAVTYYARLTQAFVTALTAPTAEGRLYEVDMRLRPSGRQGPVATSLAAFMRYQTEEAWTWEHLALTRARPVAGAGRLRDEIEAFRRDLIGRHRDRPAVLADVADMRARLLAAKPGTGGLEMKAGPGRLTDIELIASAGALLSGDAARSPRRQLLAGAGVLGLPEPVAHRLGRLHQRLSAVRQALVLIGGEPRPGTGGAALVLREGAAETLDDLAADVGVEASEVALAIAAVLAGS